MTTILAIDPGTIRLGYCAAFPVPGSIVSRVQLIEMGEIHAPAKLTRTERLMYILTGLRNVFNKIKPRTVVLERGYVGKGAQAAIAIGESRGTVIALAHEAGALIREYTANEARRLVGAGGAATKYEAQRIAARILGRPATFKADEGDAAVLAVACALGPA